MGWLRIAEETRERWCRLGLTSAADVLALPGVIVGGHPQRHCLRVELPDGSTAYLKKQHRVSWKERAASWWAGFGWASTSTREALMLTALARSGLPCPPLLAWGEHAGQAFVLLAAIDDHEDLRRRLARDADAGERRRLAAALGATLGRLHAAGYDHPDLSAKHVLVGTADDRPWFCLLDWQRGRRGTLPDRRRQARALALLDATVADELADPRTRLAFLRAYLQERGGKKTLRWWLDAVRCRRRRLQDRPRLREQRRLGTDREEGMVWVDGEALCVAEDWWRDRGGRPPEGLEPPVRAFDGPEGRERTATIPAPGTRHLTTRHWFDRPHRPGRSSKFPAPEFAAVAAFVRLRRIGLATARMLAVGWRDLTPRRRFSFLLVELPSTAVPFLPWFSDQGCAGRDATFGRLVRLLRGIHQAGYGLQDARTFLERDVHLLPADGSLLVVGADGLERSRHSPERLAERDVPALLAALPWSMPARRASINFAAPRLAEVPG